MMDFAADHPLSKKWQQVLDFNHTDMIKPLYQRFQTIPPVARIPIENKRVGSLEVRQSILKVLVTGIIIQNYPRRYALSLREVAELTGLKLTNAYFHMNKLLKGKFVEEVATLSDGRYSIQYYGVTGRLFLYQPSETDPEYLNQLEQLLEYHNADVELIMRELEDYLLVRREVERTIVDYINNNISTLQSLGIQMDQMFTLLLQLNPILKNMPINSHLFNALKIIEGMEWDVGW